MDCDVQWLAVWIPKPDRLHLSTCRVCLLEAALGRSLRLLCLSLHRYTIEIRDYPLHVAVVRIKWVNSCKVLNTGTLGKYWVRVCCDYYSVYLIHFIHGGRVLCTQGLTAVLCLYWPCCLWLAEFCSSFRSQLLLQEALQAKHPTPHRPCHRLAGILLWSPNTLHMITCLFGNCPLHRPPPSPVPSPACTQ